MDIVASHIPPATPEQIAMFKQGAAARYLERKVQPDTAERLFTTHMDKVAQEFGIQGKPLSTGATKFAHALLQALNR